jgi:hypothetical protein
MSTPVVVNFNVEIDASGSVEVFGQTAPTSPNNPVVCSVRLPVADLYASTSDALFRFKESSGDLTGISGEKWADWTKLSDLSGHLNAIINCDSGSGNGTGTMDASDALPFNITSYQTTSEYYTYNSFGRLALSAYAHYLFGHVAATAAISNDQTFIDDMNSNASGKAQLASRLADAIDGLTTTQATAIVKQVIGQDASRARGVDNNELAPDAWQALEFKANDIIYLNINLKAPTVTVKENITAQQGEPVASLFASDISYALQITLS